MSKKIAIIPARGGSKRIPRKNIMDFCGKPMIAWTIEAAREAACFDRIVVSTDDEEIAAIAKEYGAEVPFLRVEKSDDYSPISEATISALKQAEQHWQESYSTVVQLMANCPIRNAYDIKNAVTNFEQISAEFQLSAFKYGWMNPWWAAKLNEDRTPQQVYPEAMTKRSQDLDDLYCPTGAIWIANASLLKKFGTFYGDGHVFEIMPWTSAVDIDDLEDLLMAKSVHSMLHNN
ncbi:MAG: acylneuraminate cytidylyltransferase family protein [Colwellia sp.]|jgi:CMP-N-acetylneuraminic acid synthetase